MNRNKHMDERKMVFVDSSQNDGTLLMSSQGERDVYVEVRNVTSGIAWMTIHRDDIPSLITFLTEVSR